MRSASELLSRHGESRIDQEDHLPEPLDANVLTLHPRAVPASTSDLEHPVWSVVSFEGIEAGGLKYGQAAELLRELECHGVVGLCIVTDETARRITP